MASAPINGLEFFYEDSGTGLPVVFLHGFPFNNQMWDEQAALLEGRFRTLRYDQRGHGQTGAGDGQFTIEHLVDDLMALLDYRGITKAVLCGLSMGGYVALRAIERHPDRVAALVLCDTKSESDTNAAKVTRAADMRRVKAQGVPAFAQEFLKSVFPPASFAERPAVVERVRQMIEGNSALGIAGTLLALAARRETTSYLPNITVPTLVLVGDQDSVTPPDTARALHANIRASQLEIIPNAGHLSNLDNPSAFNGHLKLILERIR